MKRSAWFVLAAMVFAFSVPAVAGDYKCDGTTQECLDKMTAKLQKSGWVGIKLDETDDGRLVVKEVIADSPAKAAGFRSGDILVAMNGIEYAEENHKKMMADKETQRPGSKVTYTVERNGKRKDLSAKLAKVPQDVLAQWVGGHMLQHAEVEIAQN